jgi:hypothetical protein
MGTCYDIEGNSVDCAGSDAVGYSQGTTPGDVGAGIDLTSSPTSTPNPVAVQAGASNGVWGSLLNFGASISTAILRPQTTSTSGLRLQTNPTTGQIQYFNPATGQYIAGAVNTGGGFGGSSGILLALAIAIGLFLAFGGRKSATA